MACNGEHSCCNKLLLEPRDATLLDLFTLLFSSDLNSRRFVDDSSGEERLREFSRRWLIFISVLAQKLLLLVKTPLSLLGDAIETFLNLISINGGGVLHLLLNFLRGKMVWPDRSSETFASVVGNLDQRVKLDRNIPVGDEKYNGSLALMAAKLAYENEAFIKSVVNDHWKMEFSGFYNFWNAYQQEATTQAFIFQDTKVDPDLVVVAFRGTHPFNALAWCTDVDLSWYEFEGVGKIHRGFMRALGQQKDGSLPKELRQDGKDNNNSNLYAYYAVREMVREVLQKNPNAKFIVTGHSLGGALAILFVSILAMHEEAWLLDRLEGVYTFGQPRVGDRKFGEFMEDKLRRYEVKYWRYVYCNDMVPRLPYDDKTLLYKHFGVCIFYNSLYKGKVMVEEPNRNYFSLFWVAPKILNAWWELFRGFLIPCVAGREYREGWFLRFFRAVGLLIPGLSAHAPQDYDNSTRLGALPSFSLQQEKEIHQD